MNSSKNPIAIPAEQSFSREWSSTIEEFFSSRTAWEKVEEKILALQKLEKNWNGENGDPASPEMIVTAIHLAKYLQENEWPAAHFVCLFPDGHVALEWHHDNGVIDQIEVLRTGKGERMTSTSDPAEYPTFSQIVWPEAGQRLNYYLTNSCSPDFGADFLEYGFNLAT